MSMDINDLNNIFNDASIDGTLSQPASAFMCNNLNDTVLMGCNGIAADDILSTEVTLITSLYDNSGSIGYSKLKPSVINGQNAMLNALKSTNNKDDIMIAQWLFNDRIELLHSYVGIDDAVELDNANYLSGGATSLYDVLADAMTSNFAYAQRLKSSGTPVQNVIIVFTDGEDTSSKKIAGDIKTISHDLLKTEQYILAYAGVGNDNHKLIAESIGFPSVIKTGTSEKDIRKIFRMMSESIINVSKSVINPNMQNTFFN